MGSLSYSRNEALRSSETPLSSSKHRKSSNMSNDKTRIEESLRPFSYLTNSCANASIVVGPWDFSVPELPKQIQPELKLFTISI